MPLFQEENTMATWNRESQQQSGGVTAEQEGDVEGGSVGAR